ncbi:hypothetical protein TYRP_019101, partial [Tyrophagus putrescentiae]
ASCSAASERIETVSRHLHASLSPNLSTREAATQRTIDSHHPLAHPHQQEKKSRNQSSDWYLLGETPFSATS